MRQRCAFAASLLGQGAIERAWTYRAAQTADYDARRVSGLRRSEVATLADASVEYYTRLERGLQAQGA
ncbi:hypothetical protein [Streptomyces sp. NPDC002346]